MKLSVAMVSSLVPALALAAGCASTGTVLSPRAAMRSLKKSRGGAVCLMPNSEWRNGQGICPKCNAPIFR